MEKLTILTLCASISPKAIFRFCRNIQNGMNLGWGASKQKGPSCAGIRDCGGKKKKKKGSGEMAGLGKTESFYSKQ